MGKENLLAALDIDSTKLDDKKQQTTYKIKFVSAYIKEWLYVSTNRKNVSNIVFIDCMCNAGIYADGDLGTSMEVLKLFQKAAKNNPAKKFYLILNDYSKERMEICSKIVDALTAEEHSSLGNLTVYVSNQDVNEFLSKLDPFNRLIKWNAATVLFVDPYDFVTVNTKTLQRFIKEYYCEVIYNFFSSDFLRNKSSDRIKKYIGVGDFKTIEEAENLLRSELKAGKMRHTFSYVFKNKKNAELYRILFFTPSMRGLEKLKEVLWSVFKGNSFHRNETENMFGQASLFSDQDNKALLVDSYAFDARRQLINNFYGSIATYQEIELFLLENTMMMDAQIIDHVIKPLLESGYLIKCGLANRSNNYKSDSYSFQKELAQ